MSETKSNGMGCLTVLFFIFLALKLSGIIVWSWWWVTAPLWALPVIAGIVIGIIFIIDFFRN